MTQAIVTPELLRWARGRAQVALDDVAKSVNVTPDKVNSWEQGESYPTLRQARKIADKLKVPLGYLYLPDPPEDKLPLPDFRKLPQATDPTLSLELQSLLRDTIRKQEWYREYLIREGQPNHSFIGKFNTLTDPTDVAMAISETIGINNDLRKQASSWSEFLRLLVQNSEKVGIIVLRTGVVRNNNNRPLNKDEFRGFAISDDIAPLILINSKDAIAAQVFTFAHELVHLWIGQSGISNYSVIDSSVETLTKLGLDVEDYCNQVAAEVLVPRDSFIHAWQSAVDPLDNLVSLARQYWVSTIVILRRALDLSLIEQSQFFASYRQEVQKQRIISTNRGDGGHFYNTFFARHSKLLAEGIINAAIEGELLFRDAASLLGVKVSTIWKLAENLESS